MKKILSLILMLSLLLAGCAFAQSDADESVSFDPQLANALAWDAETWFSTSVNRALLTMLAMCDIVLQDLDDDFDFATALTASSYVGRNDSELIVLYPSDGCCMIVTYQPDSGEANFCFTEPGSSAEIERTLDDMCADGYNVNDQDDILSIVTELQSILEG